MIKHIAGALIVAALSASPGMAQATVPGFAAAQKQFDDTCAGCHGEGGAGGDRAPALTNNITLRAMNEAQIRDLIKSGTQGGMPAFNLPDNCQQLAVGCVPSTSPRSTQACRGRGAGEAFFFGKGQ